MRMQTLLGVRNRLKAKSLSGSLSLAGDLNSTHGSFNFKNLSANLSFSGALAIGAATLYVQFRANVHASGDLSNGADFIHIGLNDDSNYVAVFPFGASSAFSFYANAGGGTNAGTPVLDTWFTFGMRIQTGLSATVTPRIDGTDYSSFSGGSLTIEKLQFGAINSGVTNNHEVDDLTIGTAGFGSTDIFAADFNDFSIVPPFDSTTGTGLDASGGTLSVINGGTDAYAEKAITFP